MNIYIVEDDLYVINMLSEIVEDYGLGTVCGHNNGKPVTAKEILSTAPDVVMVDFLMPETDGIEIVRSLRSEGSDARIVMLSQVSDKEMVEKAYSEGIDFFISKPVNIIEIKSVLTQISKSIDNEKTVENIRRMFVDPGAPVLNAPGQKAKNHEEEYRRILAKTGMSGEKGTDDIIRICVYLEENGMTLIQTGIGNLCALLSDQPRSMEQRIRRAIAVGLSSMAHLGMEDFMNDTFENYGNMLFSFEEIRAEMEFIRGKSRYGGKVSIRKFIDGLMLCATGRK